MSLAARCTFGVLAGQALRSCRKRNEPCWIRTNDPVLKRHMLYLLS